ncbi:MAG: phosphoribosylamine--glycine ligase [Clostridia bacterium]|nr:phosphoribosylamine--glycine ligase [Clostridia bacterium]
MNILVVGAGGREHAIVRQLLKSKKTDKIFCTPGNGGISCDAQCFDVAATDIAGVVSLTQQLKPDMVFVAMDDPLVAGMVDELNKAGFRAFGPDKKAAAIEGSKVFSKNLMKKYGIPTAGYEVFSDPDAALSYIRSQNSYPAVIKADGLALGKGVIIAEDEQMAEAAIKTIMLDKAFGDSGNNVVVEEFLTGPEVSVLAFCDGKTVKPMVSSMDHKRALDGDKGLNTGGMGTVSPNPFYSDEMAARCMDEIFLPTVRAMAAEGRPFKGCLYFGLMLTKKGPRVIEYNCRFGDPEAQVVLPRLKTDFVDILNAVIDEKLDEIDIEWYDDSCVCVIAASGGYPSAYRKGVEITGLDEKGQLDGATIFHAGTKLTDGKFYTNGGRVLGVTTLGRDLEDALDKAYALIEKISFDGMQYRHDIGRKKIIY